MPTQRISVLVNPAAGGNRGLSRTKTLVAELADRGWTVDLLKANSAAEVSTAITDAIEAGMSRLVLAGGDGLVHHAVPALVGSGVTVGIVPVGTGNDFCRGLGLATKRSAAIDTATTSAVADVDVLSIDWVGADHSKRRFAASVATLGFSGRVNGRANALAGRRGFPKGSSRYTLATMAELTALSPAEFTLHYDHESAGESASQVEALLIAVGNTCYFGGGMAVCPDARFDDGAMDVVIVGPVPTTTFLRVLPMVFSGRHVRHPAVTTRRCKTLAISSPEPLWADGEQVAEPGQGGSMLDAVVRVVPDAIRIAGATSS